MAEQVKKILAIDDIKENLFLFEKMLAWIFPEIKFLQAMNGPDGILICETEKPDVVLLDIMMPEMNGFDVCRVLKSNKEISHIPVIMVTAALVDKELRIKALDAGADAFLAKPFDHSEFTAQIRAMLRIKESEDRKIHEHFLLETEVQKRTEKIKKELAERRKAETKLRSANDELRKNQEINKSLMNELKAEVREKMLAEKKVTEHLNEQKLISEFSVHLVSLDKLDDVYRYIGKKVFDKLDEAIVFVTVYNIQSKSIKIKFVYGIDKQREDIIDLFGFDPFTVEISIFKFSEDELANFRSQAFFNPGKNPIHFLFARHLDEGLCGKMETLLGIKRVYTMGFSFGNKVYGGLSILKKDESPLLGIRLFETLITQVSVALQRLFVEEKLHMNELLYRTLVETSPDGILMYDLNGFPLTLNKRLYEIFGYNEKEIQANEFEITKFIAPDDHEKLRLNIAKRLAGERIQNQQYTALRKDGSEFPVEVNSSVICDLDNRPYALISVIRDITERMKAERALKESERKYQFIVENTDDILWIMDGNFQKEYVSPSVFKFLGYTVEEHMRQSLDDYLTPESVKLIMNEFQQGIIHLQTKQYDKLRNKAELEIEFIRKDNTKGYGIITMMMVRDEQYRITKIRGITRDITTKKLTEIYEETSRDVLRILNEPIEFRECMQRILDALKSSLGFDAVGIRIQEGQDFPFYEQVGYSESFLKAEDSLIERNAEGSPCVDKAGNYRLGCYCGLVIGAKADSYNQLLNRSGSFWINDSSTLLGLSHEDEKNIRPRHRCVYQGYSSLAIIPIIVNDKVIGTIQLNDRRKGRFTHEVIKLLEGMALHIGISLMRKQTEIALKENEEKYRLLARNMVDVLSLIDRNGKILYINDSAYNHLGYIPESITGKDIWTYVVKDDHPKIREMIKRMFVSNSANVGVVFRVKKKNKGFIWLDSNVLFLKSDKGKVIGFQCVSRNITEKIETEKRLESERHKVMSALIDGQELERQRLSMELHDGLGQHLAGIKIKLENSAKYDLDETRRTINEVKSEFRNVIDEIRTMSMNVSPTILSNLGFEASLSMLGRQFRENNNIEFDYSVIGDFGHIPENKAFYLYRIVQEGLVNIAKHSGASIAKLALIEKEEHYLILLEDNGKGFNPDDSALKKGNGLSNMKQRALLLKGDLNIETGINSGTIIMLKIPK